MLNSVLLENCKTWFAAAVLTVATGANAALAADKDEVDAILASAAAPAGVVFEIVSGDESALDAALPRTRKFIRQLRDRHADLPVAIVSHGYEQFALTTTGTSQFGAIHEFAKSLRSEEEVTVEVCGNHAAMRGVSSDSFPEYVNVVPRAPGAIDEYVAQGYQLIIID